MTSQSIEQASEDMTPEWREMLIRHASTDIEKWERARKGALAARRFDEAVRFLKRRREAMDYRESLILDQAGIPLENTAAAVAA